MILYNSCNSSILNTLSPELIHTNKFMHIIHICLEIIKQQLQWFNVFNTTSMQNSMHSFNIFFNVANKQRLLQLLDPPWWSKEKNNSNCLSMIHSVLFVISLWYRKVSRNVIVTLIPSKNTQPFSPLSYCTEFTIMQLNNNTHQQLKHSLCSGCDANYIW